MTTAPLTSRALSRVGDVQTAMRALPAALSAAYTATDTHGLDHPDSRQAWAEVEGLGAIIHRRARLLAGKPRGG